LGKIHRVVKKAAREGHDIRYAEVGQGAHVVGLDFKCPAAC
jgi:hypothetical protein